MASVGVVCALLYRFAYAPVLKMLDTRRRQIAQGLANTETINAQLEAMESERQNVLAAARAEAVRIIATARDTAKQITDQEALHARVVGEQMMRRAHDVAEQERERIIADVRREGTHLS